jgi:hypothetical protein
MNLNNNMPPHNTLHCLDKFLDKLDDNLSKSLTYFNNIKNNLKPHKKEASVGEIDALANKIQKITISLAEYTRAIEELEDLYFCDDANQFVLSFEPKQSEPFRQQNHIDTFKKSIKSQIMKHKYSEVLFSKTSENKNKTITLDNASKLLNETITLNKIDDVDLQENILELPIIKNIQEIPPSFYWYEGDKFYKKGIYISLCKNFFIKVPFPNVINNASKDYKLNSIRCKYVTLQECQANKKKISEIHNSTIRDCYYVHKKEKFNKIGSQYRCVIESLGNYDTLDQDLEKTTNFDIKHLLMYSLSDDLLAALWYQNKFKDSRGLVFTNLDTF